MEQVIRFRVTIEEKGRIEAEAESLGISVSAFIRLLVKNWSDGIKFERQKTSDMVSNPKQSMRLAP